MVDNTQVFALGAPWPLVRNFFKCLSVWQVRSLCPENMKNCQEESTLSVPRNPVVLGVYTPRVLEPWCSEGVGSLGVHKV